MVWVSSFLFIALASVTYGQSVTGHNQVVACYVSSWAIYRPGNGKFTLDNIDPTLCTHIIYAFTGIDQNTFKIKSLDPEYDINKGGFAKTVSLKQRNPKLIVTVAVGGWIEGSVKYSNMASTMINRKSFIDSVIELIDKYGFDGLDFDWEYPSNRGGKPEDKENFVLLMKELKKAFGNRNLLLTAAVGAGVSVIDSAYDLPRLSQYLDYIHLMAYDYHGKWDLRTGHNAPLYARIDETGFEGTLNVNHSVRYYLSKGVPLNKFVLGLGVYGRTFLLNDTSNPGIGAAAMKSAFSGPYTREDGFLGYNEICEKQTSERGWAVAWQSAHQAPYMFKDNMWVSFDDHNSIGLKVAFAQRLGLAGVMVWSIDTDDFRGECSQVRFPLLRAINRNMALHAKNRYIERVSTTVIPVTTRKPISGVPLPEAPIQVPPHIPFVPSQRPIVPPQIPHVPRFPETGVRLPGIITHQPDKFTPHQTDKFTPHQPSVPKHPTHGVPRPDYPRYPDYPSTDVGLDYDKPVDTQIDFDVEGDNEVDTGSYYPAEEQSGAPKSNICSHISIIISVMGLYNFLN